MYDAYVTTFHEMRSLMDCVKLEVYGDKQTNDVMYDDDSININELRPLVNQLIMNAFDPDWDPDDSEISDSLTSCLFSFIDVLITWMEEKPVTINDLDMVIPLSKSDESTLILFKKTQGA